MGDVFGHVDLSWIPSIKSAPMVVSFGAPMMTANEYIFTDTAP